MGRKRAGRRKLADCQHRSSPPPPPPILFLLPLPCSLPLRQIQRQGAGAAPSVHGLRLRHMTQQQSPIINTTLAGKWWQVLVTLGGIGSNKRIIKAACGGALAAA